MLLAGEELKTIADHLGHSSVVLTADDYLSVAVELGLKAAAAAQLFLNAGKSPPALNEYACSDADGAVAPTAPQGSLTYDKQRAD